MKGELAFLAAVVCFVSLMVLLYAMSPPPVNLSIFDRDHLTADKGRFEPSAPAADDQEAQSGQLNFMFPTLPLTTSRMHCIETGPYYHDDVNTFFNLRDDLRTTCLFSDVVLDIARRQIVFLTDNASISIPPLSVMGRNTDIQAPQVFPHGMWRFEPSLPPVNNSSRAVLTVVSRTYETHHGHTLFDGVLPIWLALAMHNVTPREVAARTVMVAIADGKGVTPMDDRFALLTPLPLLHRGMDDVFDAFSAVPYVRIERLVLGLAGLGWAFSPTMAPWRGQQLRAFRTHALRPRDAGQLRGQRPDAQRASTDPHRGAHVVIVERMQHSSLNFFSRSIVDAERVWTTLQAHFADATWERVFFEGVSLAEQIDIVQRADVLITIEGCAMENAPFFRDGAALVGLQYNRVWPHYELLGTQHFVEYAEIAHVLMVDTWIDPQYVGIQNSGNNFPIHVYDDLLREAVTDAMALVRASRLQKCVARRCGSLRRYRPRCGQPGPFHGQAGFAGPCETGQPANVSVLIPPT